MFKLQQNFILFRTWHGVDDHSTVMAQRSKRPRFRHTPRHRIHALLVGFVKPSDQRVQRGFRSPTVVFAHCTFGTAP